MVIGCLVVILVGVLGLYVVLIKIKQWFILICQSVLMN